MHHHRLWQVELLHLPQEVHPLLSLFVEITDILLSLEALVDDPGSERTPKCLVG